MCIPFRIVAITAFLFACSALASAQTFTTLANFGEEIVRAFPRWEGCSKARTGTSTGPPWRGDVEPMELAKSGPQNARVWTLSLLDNGPGAANATAITSFTLAQTFGVACTPVIGTFFPLAVGDLASAQTGAEP
jgi:hypothetical protein